MAALHAENEQDEEKSDEEESDEDQASLTLEEDQAESNESEQEEAELSLRSKIPPNFQGETTHPQESFMEVFQELQTR